MCGVCCRAGLRGDWIQFGESDRWRSAFDSGRGPSWYFLGNGRLFARGINYDDATGPFVLLLQLFSVGVDGDYSGGGRSGTLARRRPFADQALYWRESFIRCSSFWAQSGWLKQVGFIDGGVATIQVVGGLNALCIAWIVGPRQGKFTVEGIPTAMPGHNAALVLFGCALALVGWFGLTTAPAAAAGATGMALLGRD